MAKQEGKRSKGRGGVPLRSLLLLGLVLIATFLVYARALRFGFVYDDRGQILENPAVQSWRFLPEYFTAHVWAGTEPGALGNYYRPLFLLWLRLNDTLWGSNPWGWHLTTLLLHVAVTGLVFMLALRLSRSGIAAAAAAGVFGLHPVHMEAVAWVSGVTEPLLAVLLLSSFLCYLQRTETPQYARIWSASSLLLYGLALLAKETALVLPIIVFAYEFLYGTNRDATNAPTNWRDKVRRNFWSTAPFLALIPPYIVARTLALKGFSHTVTPIPLAELVYTWPSLGWFWLRHLVWPAGLSTFYDFPAVTEPTFRNFALPSIGLLMVGLGLRMIARRSRDAAFAFVLIFVPLLPLLDLRVFLRDEFAHDRYLYLPSLGLALLAGILLQKLAAGDSRLFRQPLLQGSALLALLALLGASTIRQYGYFANEMTFYQHCVATAPRNRYANSNFGVVLEEEGRPGEALRLFRKVLQREPGFYLAIYNAGGVHYRLGNYRKAEEILTEAIQVDPTQPQAYVYLGLARLHLGRTEEAEKAVRQAIQIRDSGYGYHFALGVILKTRGDFEAALTELRKELAYYPDQTAALGQIEDIESMIKSESGRTGTHRKLQE